VHRYENQRTKSRTTKCTDLGFMKSRFYFVHAFSSRLYHDGASWNRRWASPQHRFWRFCRCRSIHTRKQWAGALLHTLFTFRGDITASVENLVPKCTWNSMLIICRKLACSNQLAPCWHACRSTCTDKRARTGAVGMPIAGSTMRHRGTTYVQNACKK